MDNDKLFYIVKNNDVAKLSIQGTYLDSYYYFIDDYPYQDSPISTRGLSLLHVAAYYDSYECMVYLIENGKSPNLLTASGVPLIHYAVLGEALECTTALLKFGADPNCFAGSEGITPLFVSARCKTAEIPKTLIKFGAVYPDQIKGARINKKYMPLREAIRFKRADIVAVLYETQVRGSKTEGTALMDAISKRMYSCVGLLLQNGCDTNFKTKSGQTALSLACIAKRADIVSDLLSYGADARAVFDQGKSFLHCAAASGVPDIICMALNSGINVKAKDKAGKLASFYVTNYTQTESISCYKLLFDAGIDINAICNGMHVMSTVLANKKTLPEVVSFLLSYGADLDLQLKTGKSIYEMGMITASPEVKELLLAWKQKNKPTQ